MTTANRYEENSLHQRMSNAVPITNCVPSVADIKMNSMSVTSPVQNNISNNIVAVNDTSNIAGGGSSSLKNVGTVQQMQASKIPVKRPRRGIKQPPDRPQRALFLFTLKNPIRKICISVVEWKYPFAFIMR